MLRLVLATAVLVTGLHAPLRAQPEIVFRSWPDNEALCHMSIPPLTSRTWQIVALTNNLEGIQGAEFFIKGMPPGYTHTVTANPASSVALGDPLAYGCNIAFSSCQAAPEVVLYTIRTYNPGSGGPATLEISHVLSPGGPVPQFPYVNACDAPLFTSHWISGGSMLLNENGGTPPANPSPVLSETDVALDTQLSWDRGTAIEPCLEKAAVQRVYFGTGVDPPLVATLQGEATSHDPGELEKDTTYSWRVEVVDGAYALSSPLWHFSTTGSVAVESSSWSSIKRLYHQAPSGNGKISP